jgi:hypothetical protein
MLEVPASLNILFILTTLITYVMLVFAMAANNDKSSMRSVNFIAILLLLWIIFQSTLALNKWYMDRKSLPPHMLFPVITAAIIITLVFSLKRPRVWTDRISAEILTWIHFVRIPVEIGLYQLALNKQVPWSMTFKGLNFDIVIGISAPIMAILYFRMKKIGPRIMKIWNVIALISVISVVLRGIGALPSPIQWWDFSQPNYAVMHFPFVWLPSFIVPVVIFSHIIALRQLYKLNG